MNPIAVGRGVCYRGFIDINKGRPMRASLAHLSHFETGGNLLTVSPATTLNKNEWNYLTQQAGSWYGTPGYCLLYSHNPPEWVALWHNEDAEAVAACFGSSCSWFGPGHLLRLEGPTTASFAMLNRLLAEKGGLLLLIPLMEGPANAVSMPWWKGVVLNSQSDWVVELPSTYPEYMRQLGKTSRNHLTAYAKRCERTVPSRLSMIEGANITLALVTELADLHRRRMLEADKKYALTPEKIARRTRLAQECGIFCGRWVDNRLIGGTLNYFHGEMAYLSLVAHDPEYDNLHCGLVCLLDTIRYLIDRGISKYNFHTRYSPYKTRMGGVERQHHGMLLFANVAVAVLWHLARVVRKIQMCLFRADP
jgi:hypothetical protein